MNTTESDNFLRNQFLNMTLLATLQRSSTYVAKAADKGKANFRLDLQKQLMCYSEAYREDVSEEQHYENIEKLSYNLSCAHQEILNGQRFRIGPAQKALNLYLKYLWCWGRIKRPPHFPIDAMILTKIPDVNTAWTQLDKMIDYKGIIRSAKKIAGTQSLSNWELITYNSLLEARNRQD